MAEFILDGARETAGDNWVDRVRRELDSYLGTMKEFPVLPPDQVYMYLSGFSARATELKIQLSRSEDKNRAAAKRLAQNEIDPFIRECDRQFTVNSRRQSVNEMEFKMAGKVT